MTELIQFSRRASKDIGRIDAKTRLRVQAALRGLLETPRRPNLDIKPPTGRSPWQRLRVGDGRVIFRELTAKEAGSLGLDVAAFLVERIVERRDLHDAVRPL